MSRKERTALYIKEHEAQLACPICHTEIRVMKQKSLVCLNNHTFDIAKQGYVNTLTRPVKSSYDKTLFQARREIIRTSKFYDPLHQKILEIMNELEDGNNPYLLDAGSGEGSHLAALLDQRQPRKVGIGIDVAKEGIQIAARSYKAIWLVADVANLPVKDESIQVVLNILSPANYDEFKRVLTKDGFLIKVVPASNYLKELRDAIYYTNEKKTYVNDKTIARFKEKFSDVQIDHLSYSRQLDQHELTSLLEMTPLAWNVDVETVKKSWKQDQIDITMAFDLLIGRK